MKRSIPIKKVGSYWVAYLARSGEPLRIIEKTKKAALEKANKVLDNAAFLIREMEQ